MFLLEVSMKKKNGMTMIEIMLSVALISLVLIFVFNILVDLRQEETLSSYRSQDQLNRSIITKTIQDDLLNRGGLADLNACTTGNELIACVQLHYTDGNVGQVKVGRDYISYQVGDDIERWTLHSGKYSCSFTYTYEELSGYDQYIMRLYFPVDLKGNVFENKMNFDIEILYIGIKPPGLDISNRESSLKSSKLCS